MGLLKTKLASVNVIQFNGLQMTLLEKLLGVTAKD